MGWRFRKSIGGKLFRVNLGKKGITSFTIGGRGMPHVTTGKSGTRVGFSIPGTGAYYTTRIDQGGGKADDGSSRAAVDMTGMAGKTGRASTAYPPLSDSGDAVTASFPVQKPSASYPSATPSSRTQSGGGATPPGAYGNGRAGGHGRPPKPWSRLAVVSLVLAVVSLALALTPAYSVGILLGLVALIIGTIALILSLKGKMRGPLAAVLAIVLSLAAMGVGGSKTPSTDTSASSGEPSSSVTASRGSAAASSKASASRSAASASASAEIADARKALASKVEDARTLLDSSKGKVADDKTRTALAAAVKTAQGVDSATASDYTDQVTALQSSMDAVSASEQKKTENDAAAAVAAKKAAEEKKAAEAAAAAKAKASAAAAAKAKAAADAAAQAKAAASASAAAEAKQQAESTQTQQSAGTAHGGAFCSTEGATAQSDRSTSILTCRVASDGRLRWKK